MASEWFAYKSKSGETVFYHNAITGEYRWVTPANLNQESVRSSLEPPNGIVDVAINQDDSAASVLSSDWLPFVGHAHADIERIQCPHCSAQFLDVFSFDMHRRSHEERFKCRVCGQDGFSRHASYVRHALTHTDETPFLCPHCGLGLKTKRKLTKHIQSHIAATFTCKYCNRGFFEKYIYEEHLRLHTGEKPLPCPTCGKTFRTKTHLWNHRRIHLEKKHYKCDTCGKSFAQVCSLLRHKKTHAGERKHRCKECDKTFTQSCSLARHLRTHTGDKFNCPKCTRTFVESWCLKKHLELKH